MRRKRGFRRDSMTFHQARLILVAALSVGFIAFLVQGAMLAATTRDLLHERERQILALAEAAAVAALAERDTALAGRVLTDVLRVDGVAAVRIEDADGVVFAAVHAVRPVPQEPGWLSRAVVFVFGTRQAIVHPLDGGGRLVAEFLLDHDLALYRHVLGASLVATLMAALLVGGVLAVLFHRFLTRPILAISRQVAAVDAEDPHSRLLTVPDWHRDSELGRAVQRINAMLIQLGAAQNALRRMTTRDSSTNLPNRTLTVEHLVGVAARVAPGRGAAVMAVLMDRFDEFKDLVGHDQVDEMVLDLAARLLEHVDPGAFVGRIGVDCFAVVVEGLTSADEATDHAKHLIDALMHDAGHPEAAVRSSVAVGIAYLPDDGDDPAELLRKAVAATASAKRRPQARWNFFEDGLSEVAHRRLQLETQLHQAIDGGAFELYFQPQFNALGVVTGAEALLRWRRDGRIVLPGAFIQVAEDSGLVVPIGEWVVEETCRAAAALAEVGRDLRIAFNVSPQQLEDAGFVGRVAEALARHRVPPRRVEVEITEYTLAMERGLVRERLRQLRAMGVRIALDDFGTGYSSLAYLRRFPVDVLKIDRGFVTDIPDDVAVPSTILTLADKLGIACVAEGIETVPQRDWLIANGCDCFQGYLFARPMPFAAFFERYASPSGVDSGFRREGHIVDGKIV
ncbi:putative Diguanylate cyclase/phosphodiesterase [uncultured Alphaproteobacteria bacterium]|uniref:Putative Diguanylate cyclase/phosphodiesterase n=1 Tax=uncultured Alphaproteobacteria bacterium TaxID=91750 RepID=A0A212IXF4_9PROT|nr:putative Diguanylate cyclase/phosphodiesterase [uncultured Alphaproteobacteria bacterium]